MKERVRVAREFGRGGENRVRALCCSVALLVGAFRAWEARFHINPDGLCYLDIADAYFRRDWRAAISASWSPLYSWILGLGLRALRPSPYWELSVVHFLNFLIYVGALVCFDFCLRGLLKSHEEGIGESADDGLASLPRWVWLVLGYALFTWSSLEAIGGVLIVGPDLIVAGTVYLAAGFIVRIRMGHRGTPTLALLGMTLGLGYLAKTAMFPIAFAFLGVACWSAGRTRQAVTGLLTALLTFSLFAGPFLIALSEVKGRFTFGDSGKVSYAWHVNRSGENFHWQGGNARAGQPLHPTRNIFARPAAYEFGTPIAGTYPPLYDYSYWNEGLTPHFSLREQIRALAENASTALYFFVFPESGFVVGVLILFLMGSRGRHRLAEIGANWHLFLPGLAGIGMYALVYLEPRYVAAFVVLLWAAVLAAIRLDRSPAVNQLVTVVVLTIIATMAFPILHASHPQLFVAKPIHWRVAQALKGMGVQPGDKVACIGHGYEAYWARLARVKIVAEVSDTDIDRFWTADSRVRSEVIKDLAQTGAKAIVARDVPQTVFENDWQRVEGTDYRAYALFRRASLAAGYEVEPEQEIGIARPGTNERK